MSCPLVQYQAYNHLALGPEFRVRGCDIARACEGYITSKDTKRGSYIQYIGPISILYTIYCMMVTSPA